MPSAGAWSSSSRTTSSSTGSIGGVELTKKQIDDLNGGKAIFVEGMKRKDGELFSSYVTVSYTHLDVYKRQVIGSFTKIKFFC